MLDGLATWEARNQIRWLIGSGQYGAPGAHDRRPTSDMHLEIWGTWRFTGALEPRNLGLPPRRQAPHFARLVGVLAIPGTPDSSFCLYYKTPVLRSTVEALDIWRCRPERCCLRGRIAMASKKPTQMPTARTNSKSKRTDQLPNMSTPQPRRAKRRRLNFA